MYGHSILLLMAILVKSGQADLQKTTVGGQVQLDAEMKDLTRYEGETLRIKCEITGYPLPKYVWKKDGVTLGGSRQTPKADHYSAKTTPWGSRLKISDTTVRDSGVYSCEGSNLFGRQSTNATLTILPGRNPNAERAPDGEGHSDNTDGLGIEGDLDDQLDYFHDKNGLGDRGPPLRPGSGQNEHFMDYADLSGNWNLDEGRKPQGLCETYRGAACSKFIGRQDILVYGSLQQSLLEEQLTAILTAIATLPSMSEQCQRYAVPALCHYIYPMCQPSYKPSSQDRANPAPQRLCRNDCRILQHDVCKNEYQDLGRLTIMNSQMLTPNCSQLTDEPGKCVKLGVTSSSAGNADLQKSKVPCFNGTGRGYKGNIHVTQSGKECLYWSSSAEYGKLLPAGQLLEWKNYCRNPSDEFPGPWCYTSHRPVIRELCPLQKCVALSEESDTGVQGMLHILIPCLTIPACIVFIIIIVQLCKRCRSAPSSHIKTPANNHHMELSAMLVKTPPKIQEYSVSSVCFSEELGNGIYGKVYRGELMNYSQSVMLPVAIKTLRADCNPKKRAQFWSDGERMVDVKHSAVLCLIGACRANRPECLLYEYSVFGDLHEYLIAHSPNSDITVNDSSGNQQILRPSDMIHIAVQISAGMDYLSSRGITHGDLAARNVLVSDSMTLKISDLGVSRDIYPGDYYMVRNHEDPMPIRWMPEEAIVTGLFRVESDVWSLGVTLWEVFSYGLQPYYGCSNTDVIEIIRAHEILSSPVDCPGRMYSLMVECWHKTPSCRPTFSDLHRKLRQWWTDGVLTVGHSSSHSGCSQHSGQPADSSGVMSGPNTSVVNSTSQPICAQDVTNVQRQRSLNGFRNGGIHSDYISPVGQYLENGNGNQFTLNQRNGGHYYPYSGNDRDLLHQKHSSDQSYTAISPYQTFHMNGNHGVGLYNKRSSPPRSLASHKSSS